MPFGLASRLFRPGADGLIGEPRDADMLFRLDSGEMGSPWNESSSRIVLCPPRSLLAMRPGAEGDVKSEADAEDEPERDLRCRILVMMLGMLAVLRPEETERCVVGRRRGSAESTRAVAEGVSDETRRVPNVSGL